MVPLEIHLGVDSGINLGRSALKLPSNPALVSYLLEHPRHVTYPLGA